VVHRLELVLDVEKAGISREHFGFADGLSQPEPFDENGAVTRAGEPVLTRDPVQGVPLGEILVGYLNGHREKAPGPVVPGDIDGHEDSRPKAAKLVPHPEAQGFFDFGLNGSYMVVREYKQDVAAFWKSMEDNAAAIKASDPEHSAHVTADWIAERVVGRDREGHLLCPGGKRLPPSDSGLPDSSVLFLERDPRGAGCPPGSHVRRAHPRDALAPTLAQGTTLLGAANNHRILRRGRKFGPRLSDHGQDDGADRGLLFICLNTDIARQFEFIQQTWLFNSDFAVLFDEVDPLVGPNGRMTIREDPLRRTVHVESFVKMAGGDYFFLPSLPALDYLARL
jgi:Dyp-type peroxidase family